jgi:hypothetical protein
MPADTKPELAEVERANGWMILVYLLVFVLLAFVTAGGVYLYGGYQFARALKESAPLEERPFDAELWKKPLKVAHGRTSRSEMVEDLLQKHDFRGWTKEKVEALLGPSGAPLVGMAEFAFVYYLGADRSFLPIDNEWLVFKLDDSGKVRDAHTMPD